MWLSSFCRSSLDHKLSSSRKRVTALCAGDTDSASSKEGEGIMFSLNLEVRESSELELWPSAEALCGVKAGTRFPLIGGALLLEVEEEDERECGLFSLHWLPGCSSGGFGKI